MVTHEKWNIQYKVQFRMRKRSANAVYSMGTEDIFKKPEEKDLGVIIVKYLPTEKHINRITRNTKEFWEI